jgi:putative tricarboxylic transport membrane protein
LLDVPVKVTNMPGDGSRKIWAYLDRHPGNAHVLVISSPNVTTDNLTGLTAFDHDAYTPLAILHNEYIAFVVRADSPLRNAADLLERLGADAGALTVALATSPGNPNHIALARVTRHAGGGVHALKVRAFDSARHAVANVMAGDTDVGAISAASAVPELAAGALRALAVSAPARLSGRYEHAPTWVEQGVDCVVGAWRGVNGARELTAEKIAFWDSALASATASDEWGAEIARNHWAPMYVGSASLRDYLPRERAEMRAALGELGLLQ